MRPRSTANFDFEDIRQRITRFESLFHPDAPLTHPAAFLARLHLKGVRYSRAPKKHAMSALCSLLPKHLDIETSEWSTSSCDFNTQWNTLEVWQKQTLLPILDIVRHALDAAPSVAMPINEPMLVLMDQPDKYCPAEKLSGFMRLLDTLLPKAQFLVTLAPGHVATLPAQLINQSLVRLPGPAIPSTTKNIRRATTTAQVLLIDVDATLPNLALMKISGHAKARGKKVRLVKKECFQPDGSEVWASCLFHLRPTLGRVQKLKAYYGNDLTRRLGQSIFEKDSPPKSRPHLRITIYIPNWESRDRLPDPRLPGKCSFCVVPKKEGPVRLVRISIPSYGGNSNSFFSMTTCSLIQPPATCLRK